MKDNLLYHFTTIENLERILRQRRLKANVSYSSMRYGDIKRQGEKGMIRFISMTRDRMIIDRTDKSIRGLHTNKKEPIAIVFNKTKLNRKYKIELFDVHSQSNIKILKERQLLAEEVIVNEDIKYPLKYTEFIYIPSEYLRKRNLIKSYIVELLTIFHYYKDSVNFVVFDKGSFKPIETDRNKSIKDQIKDLMEQMIW